LQTFLLPSSFLQADLGRALGEMHKASLGQSPHGFGFFVDNTIGRCGLSLKTCSGCQI
jgi:hypothetical protein